MSVFSINSAVPVTFQFFRFVLKENVCVLPSGVFGIKVFKLLSSGAGRARSTQEVEKKNIIDPVAINTVFSFMFSTFPLIRKVFSSLI